MKRLIKSVITGAIALVSGSAFAGIDPFYEFFETVELWANGAFGVGVAIVMLLVGAVFGIARNSPMPALSGVAAAAILHWGPAIIVEIMASGAVI